MSTTGTNPDGTERTRLDQLPRVALLAQGSAGETSEDLRRVGEKWVNRKTGRVLQTNLATDAKLLISGPHSTSSPAGTEKRGASRNLNPFFSMWLMSFQVEWTLCGIRAAAKMKKKKTKL